MQRRSIFRTVALAPFLLLFLLPACYPGGPQDFGDIGIVVTWYNKDANFDDLITYAVVEDVEDLSNEDDETSEPISPLDAIVILDEIHNQMIEAGFTLEADPENNTPDVFVMAGATKKDSYVAFQTWYGYPGYWGGGGWGYPGYYPGTGYIKFKEGSIVMELIDLRNLENDGGLPDVTSLWYAGINGALSGEGTNPEDDIRKGIAKSFDQSPYIQASQGGK